MNRAFLVCKQLLNSKPVVDILKRHVISISSQTKEKFHSNLKMELPKIIFVLGAPGKRKPSPHSAIVANTQHFKFFRSWQRHAMWKNRRIFRIHSSFCRWFVAWGTSSWRFRIRRSDWGLHYQWKNCASRNHLQLAWKCNDENERGKQEKWVKVQSWWWLFRELWGACDVCEMCVIGW
jgi:hypothetical protein